MARKPVPKRSKPQPKKPQAKKSRAAPARLTLCVKTLGQVAAFLGVAEQTVKQWRTGRDPMPGSPGAWPLDEIARWRIAKAEARQPSASDKKEEIETARAAVKLQREKMRMEREAGRLIEVDVAAGLLQRHINEHNAQAEQLADRVLSLLPEEGATFAADDRQRILTGTRKAVETLRRSMADAVDEWSHETRGEAA